MPFGYILEPSRLNLSGSSAAYLAGVASVLTSDIATNPWIQH